MRARVALGLTYAAACGWLWRREYRRERRPLAQAGGAS